VSGGDFTAKDYRTWYGTALALELLCGQSFRTQREAKRNITAVLEQIASRLGNTPSICKKCYVYPEMLERYLARTLVASPALARRPNDAQRMLVRFLSALAKQEAGKLAGNARQALTAQRGKRRRESGEANERSTAKS